MHKRQYDLELRNGSTENGTILCGNFLAMFKNWLYLCSAFEKQMPETEY